MDFGDVLRESKRVKQQLRKLHPQGLADAVAIMHCRKMQCIPYLYCMLMDLRKATWMHSLQRNSSMSCRAQSTKSIERESVAVNNRRITMIAGK